MKSGLNPILEVEASVINSVGEPEPLAGQVFYILEQSAANILDDVTSEIGYARTMNALRNHASRFFITDSLGKAKVKQLKEGTCYICGIGHTRQRVVIWNVRVKLTPGQNNLVLNNENMT